MPEPGPSQEDDDGVLEPDELDFTRHAETTPLGENRYVISTTEEGKQQAQQTTENQSLHEQPNISLTIAGNIGVQPVHEDITETDPVDAFEQFLRWYTDIITPDSMTEAEAIAKLLESVSQN